jgi:Xaa-Pro aminopeptidase
VVPEEKNARLASLRTALSKRELDGLLVTAPASIRYLSGFTGSLAYLVIGLEVAEILGDSRYWVQMEEEAPSFHLIRSGLSTDLLSLVPERIQALGLRRVGFEAQHLTVAGHSALLKTVDSHAALEPTTGLVETLRMRKSAQEVALLKTAATVSSRAFDRVRAAVRPGIRERDVAFLLEQTFRELGGEGPAFETIVASGERGALPHARAGERVISEGDLIVFDFGARVAGYCADISRTVVVGRPNAEQQRVLEAVRAAQAASIRAMRPGVTGREVDEIARTAVREVVGETDCFGHGLGHGVGLEVHERPIMNPRDTTVLEAGMVITNEPGIYLPGWGGVRLEEMVAVTAAGPEIISTASRDAGLPA